MSDISVGGAVRAGFSLARHKPLSVLAWGLFYVIVGLLPLLVIFGAMMPQMMAEAQANAANAAAHPGVVTPTMAFSRMHGHFGSNLLMNLWSLLVRSIVAAAVFRAVLQPSKRAFGYLRIGMQEVWIFLVSLVEFIVVLVGIIGAVLIAVLIGGGLAMVSKPVGVLVGAALGLLIVVGLVWVLLRLSMATVLSFDDRKFRLFESWSLTKGHSFDLFLIALLLIDFVVLFEVFAVVTCLGVVGVFMGVNFAAPGAMAAFSHQSPQVMMQTLAPFAIVFAIVAVFLIGFAQAIFIAPWAAAYRMLRPQA